MEKSTLNIYLKEMKKNKKIIKNEKLCFEQAKTDKALFDKIVVNNLGLVLKISAQYATKELPLEDIIQEGNMGLMKAIEKFDQSKGIKFSTYAVWWIRYYIFTAIFYQKRMIRLPCNKEKEIISFKKRQEELRREFGREPTIQEMAKVLKVNEKTLRLLGKIDYNHVSYDLVNTVDFNSCENGYCQPEAVGELHFLKKEIEKILSKTDKKTAQVVSLLYGLSGHEKMKIDKVASALGFSIAHIRQIKNKFFVLVKKKYSYLKDFI